jgi:DNA polymerase-3 subunit gamma/tau
MLSKHSFNALLKTLEEPPPHVKFLLATTDPQKLPVTVLSRCLQFNLKRLSSTQIVERMSHIGKADELELEPAALTRIARAANGIMRDSQSLLDQALAFGGGGLRDAEVADMLGSIDQRHIDELLQSLAESNPATLMEQVRVLHELVPDYESVLDDLATVLQQIAVVQLAGVEALDEDADIELLQKFAKVFNAEIVQLYYQIAVTGRRDLGLAPDPRVGFEMTLLRMLAFRPAAVASVEEVFSQPKKSLPEASIKAAPASGSNASASTKQVAAPQSSPEDPIELAQGGGQWPEIIQALGLHGAALQLAESCHLSARDGSLFMLDVPRASEYLMTEQQKKNLTSALQAAFGDAAGGVVKIEFTVVDDDLDTVATRKTDQSAQKMQAAHDSIHNDPNVQQLVDIFDATVEQESIKPLKG